MTFLEILINGCGVANFAYGIYFQGYLLDIPAEVSRNRNAWGGPFKYLTFWNLWLQLAYHGLALLALAFATNRRLKSARDFTFATLSFPIGVFVCVVFWALFAIDRELIFPKRFDAFIPAFENHVLHTTVLALQPLAMAITRHEYPKTLKRGVGATAAFCFAYLAWICAIAHFGGFWVYPVFKVLSPPMRVVFITVCALSGGLLYVVGMKINQAIWSNVKQRAPKRQ